MTRVPMSRLFKEHTVYKAAGEVVVIYTCLEILGEDKFAVQISSTFSSQDGPKALDQHTHWRIDTLQAFLDNPDINWWPSLQEAIDDHDQDFYN